MIRLDHERRIGPRDYKKFIEKALRGFGLNPNKYKTMPDAEENIIYQNKMNLTDILHDIVNEPQNEDLVNGLVKVRLDIQLVEVGIDMVVMDKS